MKQFKAITSNKLQTLRDGVDKQTGTGLRHKLITDE
jgi:hypothetical protein